MAHVVTIEPKAQKTLLSLRLLNNEEIIHEFVQELPNRQVQRMQLTTHRLSYMATYQGCCVTTPLTQRQVFVKDICDISIDNQHGNVLTLLYKLFVIFLPILGCACFVFNHVILPPERRNAVLYDVTGALSILWGFANIVDICKKPAPLINIGTRCAQFGAFAITLANPSHRVELVEGISQLLSNQQ
ncbi:Aste57867_6385 [Aphanomyces stellatus]|uniref:Aste57867_6384 protein n=1 Tax=Aphanomyces stellatus TaxID=120398 RepID=A0A485KFF5_9STRA|nr:hypothetical protein As57867_006369 [Aphanomyces stellatus]KAF0708322.1 hypothetical protein As57867_006370 [Aphanomyces stellatus]VFT83379.1 Aste57867_6384 [Aphanomyces stellatus]VFT83380.1 Aste57867_6385 [Aphanomyces stellatus]